MNKTIKKEEIGVGSLENASNKKTPCALSKVKLPACAKVHALPFETTADQMIAKKPWSLAQHSKTMLGNATTLQAC